MTSDTLTTSPPSTHSTPLEAGHAESPFRVWDLPTRLFHWALAFAVIGLLVTGLSGVMEWHFRLGYVVLALLLFRLVWGFIGGRWSRFASFIYSPMSLVSYLRGRGHPDHLIGHSPTGALSVFALLGLLLIQVATGLVADDEIAASGPLSRFVSGKVVSAATFWHAEVGKWIVIALVVLHVLAVLFYVLVKKHRLVRPMLSGDKQIANTRSRAPSRDDLSSRLVAVVVMLLCGALATWIASLRV